MAEILLKRLKVPINQSFIKLKVFISAIAIKMYTFIIKVQKTCWCSQRGS